MFQTAYLSFGTFDQNLSSVAQSSLDPYLEILLEVKLTFQVRITIILTNNDIFAEQTAREVLCGYLITITIPCYQRSIINQSLVMFTFNCVSYGVDFGSNR